MGEVLTVAEAAELLKVSPSCVRELARDRQIPARKVGRAWRFSRDALLDWVRGSGSRRQRYDCST